MRPKRKAIPKMLADSPRMPFTNKSIPSNGAILSQNDVADSVMYIRKGHVKLSVTSKTGREAVVAILRPGDFLGEECLEGQQQTDLMEYRKQPWQRWSAPRFRASISL
jgi:CRP-like cAMP-binding protein